MKQTILILFLLAPLRLFAPDDTRLPLLSESGLNPFKTLINATGYVESKHDTLACNPKEGAYGFFQVRQIRLDDFYQRTGIRYSLTDMYDYEKAEEVFLYYASQIGPYDFEKIAKNWNGSGSMVEGYWNRVKARL